MSGPDQSELQNRSCPRCGVGLDERGSHDDCGKMTGRTSYRLEDPIPVLQGDEIEERASSLILPQQRYRSRAVILHTQARHRETIETSLLNGTRVMLSSETCSEGAVVSCPW